MLESRPIISITLGYIIGIIMGLYCKISIVFLYLFLIPICFLFKREKNRKFKLISFRRYSRYLKIIFTLPVLKIIIISSIISNTSMLYQNNKYQNLYKNLNNKEILISAQIVSNKKEKDFKNVYKIKIYEVQLDSKYKNTYLYLNTKKEVELHYGEKITFTGTFTEPTTRRNYKGFDYKEYLKILKIYGTIELENIKNKNKPNFSIFELSNRIFLKLKEIIYNNFSKQNASILLGLILGYTDEIENQIIANFSESNISHILAISGMHVNYITICVQYILYNLIGKRKGKTITCLVLLLYMFITGFSPSVVRAGIMAIISIMSGVVYRKNDTWNNLFFSFLVLLIYNPFYIKSISVLLSFTGTIGILVLQKNTKSVTLSATLFIMPIMAVFFNTVSKTSLFISIIVGWIIGPIIILGFLFIFIFKILEILFLKNLYINILGFLLEILSKIAEIGSKLPLNKIYVTTPNFLQIIVYYSLILVRKFFIQSIS